MFYAHFVLAKKGPLARIWLAAHWDKKLTKAHVFETSIEKSVEGILHPKVKMALRTSGHLLLGVVRIYSRKAKYLLADCNEAFVKIKMAFRPGMVDLPEESREAAVNAITLPEVFHDFDTSIPEINDVDIQAQLSMNQSRAEEITLREDYGSFALPHHDEGFGDLDFNEDEPEFVREAGHSTPAGGSSFFGESSNSLMRSVDKSGDIALAEVEDGFGAGSEMMDGSGPGLFEDAGGLFDDPPLDIPPAIPSTSAAAAAAAANHHRLTSPPTNFDSDDDFDGPPSPMGSMGGGSPAPSPLKPELPVEKDLFEQIEAGIGGEKVEEESFALAPIEMPLLKGGLRTGSKRKRKLVVDEIKNISGEEMKGQLSDTSDIVTTLDLAPPTKRLMHWKETGGVEKLFALPGRHIPSRMIGRNYQNHLTSRPADNEVEDAAQQALVDEPPALGPPEETRRLSEDSNKEISKSSTPEKSKRPSRGVKRKASEAAIPEEPPLLEAAAATSTPAAVAAPPPLINGEANLNSLQMTDESSFFKSAGINMSMMENMGYDGSMEIGHGQSLSDNVDKMLGSVALPTTPWGGEDYDFPASVGQPDELQHEEETYEEYEERVLNRRALQMHHIIRSKMECSPEGTINFNTTMCNSKNTRKQVAQKFYTLLVLKKAHAIELSQDGSYADMLVTRGTKFDTASL